MNEGVDDFSEQCGRLAVLFPRGRFAQDEDGTCVLRARPGTRDHVFEHTPGCVVGLFYEGGPIRYLRALRGLVLRHLAGDGEGILYLAWTPELAARLPAFSRGRRRGVPFRPATEALSAPQASAAERDGCKAA